jgi:hypothetical protein
MVYSALQLTIDILNEGIKVFHTLFTNNLTKNNDGKFIIDKSFKNDPKNTLEQIIFSCALSISLLEQIPRFYKSLLEIEKLLVKSLHEIILENESLDYCLNDNISYHSFLRLRYYQYQVLLTNLFSTPQNDVKKDIFKFLYLNPMVTGLLSSEKLMQMDHEKYLQTLIVFNAGLESFSEGFSKLIKELTFELDQIKTG